jgi:putative SOS response-associated peptidase YedK
LAHPYQLDATAAQIAQALGADAGKDVWAGGGIAPGSFAPVAVQGKARTRYLIPRQWGVPPPPRGTQVVTHVRNLESPFWIGTLRHTEFRCLVPATAFRGGAAWFAVPAQPVFAFAGIWRDSEVPSFAILTTPGDGLYPAEAVATLPVILRPDDYGKWLSADWKLAQDLVAPDRVALRRLGQRSDGSSRLPIIDTMNRWPSLPKATVCTSAIHRRKVMPSTWTTWLLE